MMTLDIRYIDDGFLVWIIPLMYLSHRAVNWVCTAGFAVFAFIGFYFGFLVLSLLLLYYIFLHSALPLVFYSTSLLLLSYHTVSIPCLISFAVYLLAPACLCPRHGFQCTFMTWIYQYTCAYLCSSSGFRITTRRGVLTPLDPHVQVLELERVDSPTLLKRRSPADRPEPHPFRSPTWL